MSSRTATLAALFAAVQFVSACGGGDDDDGAPAPAPVGSPAPAPAPAPNPPAAPTTISPLKTLVYDVARENDGTAFTGAGAVSDPTTSGASLSLGAAGTIVLTVDASSGFVITTPDYTVVNRFAGSVLMLCDATTTPGDSTARYVAVADSVAQGGVAPQAVTDAAALAGLRFFKMSNCSYQSATGAQGQNIAADADSLYLEFDAGGNASGNATTTYSAAEFNDMLANGSSVGGSRFAAWRFTVNGQDSIVLVELGDYDAGNQVPGFVKLWLPQ
jgi:hypothetical protein